MLPSLGGLAGLRFCGLAARGSSSALFAQAAADFVQQVGDDAHFRNAEERAQPEHGYEADAAADDKVQKAQGHAGAGGKEHRNAERYDDADTGSDEHSGT